MSPCQQSHEAGSRRWHRVGQDDGCGEMDDVTCDCRFTHRCVVFFYCVLTTTASQLLTFLLTADHLTGGLTPISTFEKDDQKRTSYSGDER